MEQFADDSIVKEILNNRQDAIKHIQNAGELLQQHIKSSPSITAEHHELQRVFNESVKNIFDHHDSKDTFEISKQRIGLCLDPDGKCTCEKPTKIDDLLLNVVPTDKCVCEHPLVAETPKVRSDLGIKKTQLSKPKSTSIPRLKTSISTKPVTENKTIEESLEEIPLDIKQLNLGPYARSYTLT